MKTEQRPNCNIMNDNEFEFKPYTPPKQYVNVFLIIAGVIFAFAVIYFSFNRKVVNNEVPINNIEVNKKQPAIDDSSINENLNNDVSEREYDEPISQDVLLNFITQSFF